MCLSHHLLQTPCPLLLPNPPPPTLCLTYGCSQTVFQKLSKTKQNFPPFRGSKEEEEEEEERPQMYNL